MNRRGFLRNGTAALALTAAAQGAARADGHGAIQGAAQNGADALIEMARAASAQPYQPVNQPLLPPFNGLDYDAFRTLRPLPGLAARIPLGHRFNADLLPPGWLFRDPVAVVLPGQAEPRSFDPAQFAMDPDDLARLLAAGPQQVGLSGLRLSYPLNRADHHDDLLVVQGASYFRALARGTAYGLSARALGLGTGGPGPEEFPVISRIEVFGTEPGALHLGCLIDSPRAAAALIVRLAPGVQTVMDCALHLFPRVPLHDAGIAPLTSMFQHGDIGPAAIDDFRPAVHDSDALFIDNGAGERVWRPLSNPASVQMSAFADTGPQRFGLIQTPSDFHRFRDAEGAYHRRPSAIVEPVGDWGPGAVMLLEIPTRDEYADNIVAFWRPAGPLDPGQGHRFEYRLRWLAPGLGALPPGPNAPGWIPARSATGINPAGREGRLFVLDFSRDGDAPPPEDLRLDLGDVTGARIGGEALYPLPDGTLRASFILTPDAGTDSAELRLRLRDRQTGRFAAPVWLFRWTRARGGGP